MQRKKFNGNHKQGIVLKSALFEKKSEKISLILLGKLKCISFPLIDNICFFQKFFAFTINIYKMHIFLFI